MMKFKDKGFWLGKLDGADVRFLEWFRVGPMTGWCIFRNRNYVVMWVRHNSFKESWDCNG